MATASAAKTRSTNVPMCFCSSKQSDCQLLLYIATREAELEETISLETGIYVSFFTSSYIQSNVVLTL
jgi:hypothetical protein